MYISQTYICFTAARAGSLLSDYWNLKHRGSLRGIQNLTLQVLKAITDTACMYVFIYTV